MQRANFMSFGVTQVRRFLRLICSHTFEAETKNDPERAPLFEWEVRERCAPQGCRY